MPNDGSFLYPVRSSDEPKAEQLPVLYSVYVSLSKNSFLDCPPAYFRKASAKVVLLHLPSKLCGNFFRSPCDVFVFVDRNERRERRRHIYIKGHEEERREEAKGTNGKAERRRGQGTDARGRTERKEKQK
jgi:hypothetical protein